MTKNFEISEMVEIPASEFTMGDTWGDGEADEQPTYKVQIECFQLSKFAITNKQFLFFLNDIGKNEDDDGNLLIDIRGGMNNYHIYHNGTCFTCKAIFDDIPVTYVSWFGAIYFCKWLSYRTNKIFKLPTEEQWQYASMGHRYLKWGLGNTFDPKLYISGKEMPFPVNFGEKSEFGLFNMTGNILEWCQDEYKFSLNKNEKNILKHNRIIKGGAFIFNDSVNFRNAKRFSCYQTSCLNCIGFRIVSI